MCSLRWSTNFQSEFFALILLKGGQGGFLCFLLLGILMHSQISRHLICSINGSHYSFLILWNYFLCLFDMVLIVSEILSIFQNILGSLYSWPSSRNRHFLWEAQWEEVLPSIWLRRGSQTKFWSTHRRQTSTLDWQTAPGILLARTKTAYSLQDLSC